MYEPYTWTNGEVITAEKLNHIEEGVEENSPLIIHGTLIAGDEEDTVTLDKTYAEIDAAYEAGRDLLIDLKESSSNGERHRILPLAERDNLGCFFSQLYFFKEGSRTTFYQTTVSVASSGDVEYQYSSYGGGFD